MTAALPVTGAWRPGDPQGNRQFFTFPHDRPFALDTGVALHDVTIAYETWGRLDATASNAILVCHAWTGDSHAAGPAGRGHTSGGWWDDLIGPGKPLDTDRWFIVCSNVLGGCQGSTGPASPHPVDALPYGSRFPVVTVRDMVRAQARLANHLGIDVWHSVIGGSMGGMQVLEWAARYSDRVYTAIPIATAAWVKAAHLVHSDRMSRLHAAARGFDDLIGRVDDVAGRAVVLGQEFGFGAVIFLELANERDLRPLEGIDVLVVVAHGKEA